MSNLKSKSKKRRLLDESILSKARKYIKKPKKNESENNDDEDDYSAGEDDNTEVVLTHSQEREVDDILLNARSSGTLPNPNENKVIDSSAAVNKTKLRKPRHPDRKSKSKEKAVEEVEAEAELPKKSKKKKKRKTKKKTLPPPPEKNLDLEKRFTQECLQYLNNWHKHRSLWKFEKRKQIWLLKNILNTELIPDSDFQILANYVGSIQGAARKPTETEMKAFMEIYETKYLGNNYGMEPPAELETTKYNRARSIVQMLSD